MQYRKTRKQRKQKGGAGLFSLVSKPAPPLPFESYASSINRVYTFLYGKISPDIPGHIPLKAGQTILTQDQKDFFRAILEIYKNTNSNGNGNYKDSEFVRVILGAESPEALSREIQAIEAPNTQIEDIVLKRPAIAQSYAGSWGRFLPVILASEKQITYRQNWEQHICRLDSKVDQNKPIKSLEEKRCILVYHNEQDFPTIEAQFQLVYGDKAKIGPGFPFLFVEKEYMPVMNEKPFPYTMLQASKLMNTSYVLDAFINNGVKKIQKDLANIIEKEQKRLWNQYSLVKVVNHKNLGSHDIYLQKFISVTDDFPHDIGSYFLLPTLTSLEKIKGMDVQSTLQMRVRYPNIWKTLGTDPNLDFFQKLFYKEQINFAVLQFKQFIKMVSKYPDTAFQTVYLSDLRLPATKELFLQNIEAESQEVYRALLNRHN